MLPILLLASPQAVVQLEYVWQTTFLVADTLQILENLVQPDCKGSQFSTNVRLALACKECRQLCYTETFLESSQLAFKTEADLGVRWAGLLCGPLPPDG